MTAVGPSIADTLGLTENVSEYPGAFTEVSPSITDSATADATALPLFGGVKIKDTARSARLQESSSLLLVQRELDTAVMAGCHHP